MLPGTQTQAGNTACLPWGLALMTDGTAEQGGVAWAFPGHPPVSRVSIHLCAAWNLQHPPLCPSRCPPPPPHPGRSAGVAAHRPSRAPLPPSLMAPPSGSAGRRARGPRGRADEGRAPRGPGCHLPSPSSSGVRGQVAAPSWFSAVGLRPVGASRPSVGPLQWPSLHMAPAYLCSCGSPGPRSVPLKE